MKIYNKEIKTFEDIEDLAYDELIENDYQYGTWFDDIDAIHDMFCDCFETEDEYQEFKKLIDDNRDTWEGFELVDPDPYAEARAYYNSTRGI